MTPVFIFFLFLVVYLDVRSLRRQNAQLVSTVIEKPVSPVLIIFSVFAVAACLIFKEIDAALLLGMLFYLPVYLFRRREYLGIVNDLPRRDGLINDAFGVLLWWFLSMMMLSVGMEIYSSFLPEPLSELMEMLIVSTVSFLIMLSLIYQVSPRISPDGFKDNVALVQHGKSVFKVWIVPVLGGLFFAYFSANILLTRGVQPETPLSEVLDSSQPAGLFVLFLFLALMVAPLVEEIIFRGYFFRVLQEVKGTFFAIGFIAFIFAALHVYQYWGDWLAIAVVACLSVGLTLLRAWSGSTAASSVMHYCHNIGVTIIPFILIISAPDPMVKYKNYFDSLDPQVKQEIQKEIDKIKVERR